MRRFELRRTERATVSAQDVFNLPEKLPQRPPQTHFRAPAASPQRRTIWRQRNPPKARLLLRALCGSATAILIWIVTALFNFIIENVLNAVSWLFIAGSRRLSERNTICSSHSHPFPTFKLYDQRTKSQHPRLNVFPWGFVADFSPNSHRHKTPSWLGYLIKFYIVELLQAEKTCLMCCHTYGLAIYSNFSISTLHVNNATRFTDSQVVFIAAQRALALCGRCSGADGTLARRFSILMTLLIKNSMPKLLGIPSQKINKPPLVLAPERPLECVTRRLLQGSFEWNLQLWERSHLCSDPNSSFFASTRMSPRNIFDFGVCWKADEIVRLTVCNPLKRFAESSVMEKFNRGKSFSISFRLIK